MNSPIWTIVQRKPSEGAKITKSKNLKKIGQTGVVTHKKRSNSHKKRSNSQKKRFNSHKKRRGGRRTRNRNKTVKNIEQLYEDETRELYLSSEEEFPTLPQVQVIHLPIRQEIKVPKKIELPHHLSDEFFLQNLAWSNKCCNIFF